MKDKHPILLVDDEPEILFSLRGLLRHDFDVYTAAVAPRPWRSCDSIPSTSS